MFAWKFVLRQLYIESTPSRDPRIIPALFIFTQCRGGSCFDRRSSFLAPEKMQVSILTYIKPWLSANNVLLKTLCHNKVNRLMQRSVAYISAWGCRAQTLQRMWSSYRGIQSNCKLVKFSLTSNKPISQLTHQRAPLVLMFAPIARKSYSFT